MKNQNNLSSRFLKVLSVTAIVFLSIAFMEIYGASSLFNDEGAQEAEAAENTDTTKEIPATAGTTSTTDAPVQADTAAFAGKHSSLPMQPTDIAIIPDRFVPRIGSEIAYQIDLFGFENIDTGIGSDYSIAVFDYESEKNQVQKLKRIRTPEVQIEQWKNGEWINQGVNVAHRISTSKSFTGVREDASYAFGEKQSFSVERESIAAELQRQNIDWGKLSLHNIFFNLRNANGTTNYTQAHRLTHSGTVDFIYEITDAPANSAYVTLQGISEWYQDSVESRDSKGYPINWLYLETSDISIELLQPKLSYSPNDVVELNVRIENTSQYLANRRLVAGLDFGQKDIESNSANTIGEPDLHFEIPEQLGAGNLITATIPAGQALEFVAKIVLPDNFDSYLSGDGSELALTPFLYTSNILGDDNGKTEYYHYEEREYNQGIKLPVKQGTEPTPQQFTVSFDSTGGSTVASQMIRDGEKAVPPSAPIRDGYIFDNWYMADVIYDFSIPVVSDITLNARWIQDSSHDNATDNRESGKPQPSKSSTDYASSHMETNLKANPNKPAMKENSSTYLHANLHTGVVNVIPNIIVSLLLISTAIFISLSQKNDF